MRSRSVSVAILTFTLFGPNPGSLIAQAPSLQTSHHPTSFTQPSPSSTGAIDPGPRGGNDSAGGALHGLSGGELNVFNESMSVFMEVGSVSGTIPGEEGVGLGPTFNGNSCAQCHAQPSLGGSSPGLASPQNPVANPQVALATANGATNTVPPFVKSDGPVREARFIRNHDGTADGGVHGLFTITGRSTRADAAWPSLTLFANSAIVTLAFASRLPRSDWGWWKRLRMGCFATTLPRINVSSQR